MRNDLDGLRSALANRSVSVYDEIAEDGTTALRQAWQAVHRKAAALLLLQTGADLFQGSTPSEQPIAYFLKSLHNGTSSVNEIAFVLPISLTAILDEWAYTDLHRIILGILPLDLPTVLRNSRAFSSEVSSATISDFTPLPFAAMRNGIPALHALINAGADLQLRSDHGVTAFHCACMGHSFAAARISLDHRTNIHAPAAVGYPLHYTSYSAHDEDPRLTDLLIDRGADVNVGDLCGSSALADAVVNDHVKLTQHLLNRGANIDAQDDGGDTALSGAVASRSHRSARMLLARGADYRTVNTSGLGILHLLADSADEEMLELFIYTSMSGLDVTLPRYVIQGH